jgi:hypothetical protein
MNKIKLSIEDLRVESFPTSAAERGEGTVLGHEKTNVDATECGPECDTWYGVGACSANDACQSSPHAWTPCAGCVETAFCEI